MISRLLLLLSCFYFVSFNSKAGATEELFSYLDEHIWLLMDNGDYSAGLVKSKEVATRAEKVNSPRILATAYNTLGSAYLYTGNYPEALKVLYKALRIREELKDIPDIANTYNNIANVYYSQKDLENALKNFNNSLRYLEQTDIRAGIAATANNIGLIHADRKEFEKALAYFRQSYVIDSTDGNTEGLALSHLNFGRAYFDQGNYIKAEQHYSKGLELIDSIQDTYIISKLLLNSSNLDVYKKDFKTAKMKADKALEIAEELDNPADKRDVFLCYHTVDSAKADHASAYFSYRQFIKFRDMVQNEENAQRSAEARVQYEFDKKQAVLEAEQEKKNAILKEEQSKQRVIRDSLLAGFALVLVLAGVSYKAYVTKKKANIEVSRQKEEISFQKTLVEEKNKEIVDSINYARQLQTAILPPQKLIDQYLPGNFILFKPKDIVAGDFYFFESTRDTLFIAAADCTGHGVPGAMVSVICCNALSRTVKEFGIEDPAKILDKVNDLVLETFEKSELTISDGMDISLVAIERSSLTNENRKLTWAGANNPLWILRKKDISQAGYEFEELKGNKQPIGRYDNRVAFQKHEVLLKQDDQLYLFSDGFADQFGGPKGKKFRNSQLKETILDTARLQAPAQKTEIEQLFEAWRGDQEQTDDVTLIRVTL